MAWIGGLITLGIFIVLMFVKPSSAKGTMKLAIYGTRVITLLIALIGTILYWHHQQRRGMTLSGESIESLDTKDFIGEWGFIREGYIDSQVITFNQNGSFTQTENNDELSGKWIYDGMNKELYLHFPRKSIKYKIQGKNGIKIMFVHESKSWGTFDTEYSLVRRNINSLDLEQQDEKSSNEKMLFFTFYIWFFLFMAYIITEGIRLFYKLLVKRRGTTEIISAHETLTIITNSLGSVIGISLILIMLMTNVMKACSN